MRAMFSWTGPTTPPQPMRRKSAAHCSRGTEWAIKWQRSRPPRRCWRIRRISSWVSTATFFFTVRRTGIHLTISFYDKLKKRSGRQDRKSSFCLMYVKNGSLHGSTFRNKMSGAITEKNWKTKLEPGGSCTDFLLFLILYSRWLTIQPHAGLLLQREMLFFFFLIA